MLLLVITASWLLVAGKSVALPTTIGGISSSSAMPVVIDSDFGRSWTDGNVSSSLGKGNSAFSSYSTNGSESTGDPTRTRLDYPSTTTPSSRNSTSPLNSIDTVDAVLPTSSSTAAGSSRTPGGGPITVTPAPDYALTFAELLAAITAEFVFNVAGDHVLFPVGEDPVEDRRLHANAVLVAELLQRLHLTSHVYRVLNASSCAVAEDMQRIRRRASNPVAEVLRQTTAAASQDPQLRDEFAAVKQRLANQIDGLPAQHGQFAATRTQTLYDVSGEQMAYAQKLMEDGRVKKLIMSVTFFKASQFEETAVPEWVRSQTSLARATLQLAQQLKWRDEVQRVFDEAVAECVERFDAMAGDDELVFQALREKVAKNAPLSAELKRLAGELALTNT